MKENRQNRLVNRAQEKESLVRNSRRGLQVSENRTLYDDTIEKLKNRRVVVVIILAVVAVGGLAILLERVGVIGRSLITQKTEVSFDASLESYDILSGSRRRIESLRPVRGDIHEVESLAETISAQI